MGNKKKGMWKPGPGEVQHVSHPSAVPAHTGTAPSVSEFASTPCPKCKSASTVLVKGVNTCNACGAEGWK
jgi:hypothetical protein